METRIASRASAVVSALWDYDYTLRAAGFEPEFIPLPVHVDRIASVALDETTVLRRTDAVEQEREVAMRDLEADNRFVPVRAVERGHAGPWSVVLSVADGRLAMAIRDGEGAEAETIGLGLARFRRVVREYFAICDSFLTTSQ